MRLARRSVALAFRSEARRHARGKRWLKAARTYRLYLRIIPNDSAAWIQLGHCLKEAGHFVEASRAYENATDLQPNSCDAWFQRADLLRITGKRDQAINAYAATLANNPNFAPALDALLALGARDALPARAAALERGENRFPISKFSEFRDAHNEQLLGESDLFGNVDRGSPLLNAYSSKIAILPFSDGDNFYKKLPNDAEWILVYLPNAKLNDSILSWFKNSVLHSGVSAVYCDYTCGDSAILQPMFDEFWFDGQNDLPAIFIAKRCISSVQTNSLADLLLCAAKFGQIVHVPLPLAEIPCRSQLKKDPSNGIIYNAEHKELKICVIVQTRDQHAMLKNCVESLIATADDPTRLDIIIVNNRSIEQETADLLDHYKLLSVARTIDMDEEFNWSKSNNLAAKNTSADIFLFANNDIEMISNGWDSYLARTFSDLTVGIIGALLLYPDKSVQHGGVILGMNAGHPIHEGIGKHPEDGILDCRWTRNRLASAVTGAWLATTRSIFEGAKGFNESLPVSYNDIDFCLRVRSSQHKIIQAGEIKALHHESVTRGLNLTKEQVERDEDHFRRFTRVWGDVLELDPAYNPNWTDRGQPFDGYRVPSRREIIRWISKSASPSPWSVEPRASSETP